ncbi:Asp-tRNA(Asn)/Glu-tRNA(Gln) amidotransferase subunit GatB [Candidatus Dojkabacteria bacterium]|jgi:aspartyl-tRNA(Asn)/glutamyl-tRNA(Gln) amidotransferase subunit B|nr:Asp-tRNA(Asn)/Glu-tRNA(Gln) amidotransferase subunit GatB [Candidatus Dojkabacteria bacterium]
MSDPKYEIIIGLEVHIQSKTDSKMFCSCSTKYFGRQPNTHTCPVCLGLPGALPVPNKKAIDLCIKTALALNCKINHETKFDRKNYFYPDLPKGFQISQYDQPIGVDGHLDIEVDGRSKSIGITRVHQEEDTGKSIHADGQTYLDFNKSGMPLIEVVSEPDMRSKEEVTAYAKMLRQTVRYLDVSNADMERGEMRFEVNMSLRVKGEENLPKYKVEVKNIGSISVLEKVIDNEYQRQLEILEGGSTPKQETRGLVDMSGITQSQRSKEDDSGYRYFPEPDIPLIVISDEEIKRIKAEIPELPVDKKNRYITEYKIESKIADNIISEIERFKEFEGIVKEIDINLVRELAKWYVMEYFSLNQKEKNRNFKLIWLPEIIEAVLAGKITRSSGKEVLAECFRLGITPAEIIKENGHGIISNDDELEKIVLKIIEKNPKAVEDFKRNPNAMMFLVGMVMRDMKGKADVAKVTQLVKSKLA